MRRLSPEAVALRSAGHPWFTVAAWIVAVVVAVGLSSNILGDVLTTDARLTNNPESERAATLIEEHLGVKEGFTEVLIVSSPDLTVDDPAFEAHVRSVATAAREVAEPSPRGVVTFYDVGDPGMVSDDRHTTLVPVTFAYAERNDQYLPHIEALVEQAGTGSFEAHTFGRISMEHELSGISEEDLRKGESIGVLVALIVLLSVFGTVVASLLPIALALASIGAALGLVALVGLAFELSFFITNILTMMGLAVGVDYSLFIVSRYREERGRGLDKHAAIGVAGATAGRAVVFSGITVMLALAGMLLLPNTIFRSLGTGAMLVVFATIVASLTLLPALLSLLGDRIDALRVGRRNRGEAAEGRFWDRVARR
ncbi:MAG TPA: MMPL family transporter, partial [Acidimicrobiia bacterium]|nr:MMPL family transporter [Acidimicrobiia bacterium]